ncbi:TetR/AcrR family transcriptional regulator [Brevibacillus fulvus]|uniref:AcrR family transcriptional regulator n=1 Tax=Brevibacillus fulvus TaxID=1125967 RepID=A0A939BNS0_9BACL|nr:TetR/AcrR family transcriptional regulator [Brevibacillus fulvus]MBM7589545.1 AcrR family transcriptional regulator [Brevibacillus fulvus]
MTWEKTAIAAFIECGYEQVDLTNLAEKCGLESAYFTSGFKDKYHLFQHLMEACFSLLAERLERVFQENEHPVVRLHRLLLAFGEFGIEQPECYQIAMMIRPVHEPQHFPVESAVRVRGIFRKAYRQAAKAGYVSDEVPLEQAVQGLMCVIHGTVSSLLVLTRINMTEPRRLLAYVTSNYLAGMLSPQSIPFLHNR